MERLILDESYFEGRLEEANKIADQNERYATTLTDESFDGFEKIRSETQLELQVEQAQTLAELATRDNSPYEQLAIESLEVEAKLEETSQRFGELSDIDEAQKARLLKAAKRAVELAPLIETRIGALVDEEMQKLPENPSKHELAGRIARLTARLEHLEQLQEMAGTAWPMPLIPQETEPTVAQIDEIPIEPETLDINRANRKHPECHGRIYDAAKRAAALFMERANIAMLPSEIAEIIYVGPLDFEGMSDAEIKHNKIIRVHSLLNKKKTFVRDILKDEGFVLQYGWRHFVDQATGKNVRPKHRIYRAVERVGEDAPDTFIETKYVRGDQIVHSEVTGMAVESSKTEERHRHIEELVGLLADNGLMPTSIDEISAVATLRSDFMQSRRYFDNLKSPAIDALRTFVLGLSKGHKGLNAHEIVFAAVGEAFGKRLGKTSIHGIQRIVESVVADYYESRESEDAGDELSA